MRKQQQNFFGVNFYIIIFILLIFSISERQRDQHVEITAGEVGNPISTFPVCFHHFLKMR